jgi:hypothetical protein
VFALAIVAAVAGFLPAQGTFVPHESLAGVRLGDTPAQVRTAIGTRYTVCKTCDSPSWFYFTRAGFSGGESGLGVSFRQGRVAAVYTLGYPRGWRTPKGLKVGQEERRLLKLYGGGMSITECIGYMAHSRRGPGVVSTFFTMDAFVSGFALTLPSEPVCR